MRRNSASRSPSPAVDQAPRQDKRQNRHIATDFLKDKGGHRPVKRRQSALSAVATNPAPAQRQRSHEETGGSVFDETEEVEAGPSTPPRVIQNVSAAESEDDTSSAGSSQERYILSRQSGPPLTSEEAIRILTADLEARESPEPDGEQIRGESASDITKLLLIIVTPVEDMRQLLDGEISSLPDFGLGDGHGMDIDSGLPDMEALTDLNDMLVDMDDEDFEDNEEGDFDEDDDDPDEDDADDFGFDDPMDMMEQPRRTTVFDNVDMITPRRCYRGAKNTETVKDCKSPLGMWKKRC